MAADNGSVGAQIVFFDDVDDRFRGDAGHGISAEGGDGQALDKTSAISGVAMVRPMGTPLPRPLAAVMMSGSTSQCSMPNHLLPVRPQPVCTSSEMKVAAVLLHDAEGDLEVFLRRRDEAADALNGLGDQTRRCGRRWSDWMTFSMSLAQATSQVG